MALAVPITAFGNIGAIHEFAGLRVSAFWYMVFYVASAVIGFTIAVAGVSCIFTDTRIRPSTNVLIIPIPLHLVKRLVLKPSDDRQDRQWWSRLVSRVYTGTSRTWLVKAESHRGEWLTVLQLRCRGMDERSRSEFASWLSELTGLIVDVEDAEIR